MAREAETKGTRSEPGGIWAFGRLGVWAFGRLGVSVFLERDPMASLFSFQNTKGSLNKN